MGAVLVVVTVVALGYALQRLRPDPPNPLRSERRGFLTHNVAANTWWTGSATVLLAPVLAYLEGLPAGAMILAVGAALVALSTWVLSD